MDRGIDESLYSRQIYVLGHEAMHAMQSSTALVYGLSGVGVEIAKNIILAGIKNVILIDPTPVSIQDMSSGYYFTESDVQVKTRLQAALPHLITLNRYVHVIGYQGPFHTNILTSDHHVSICVWAMDHSIDDDVISANEYCIEHQIKFIRADVFGVCGMVFVDNGDDFTVRDIDGEAPLEGLISHISNESDPVITCYDETRHGLSTGDRVVISDVEGMADINGIIADVTVIGPYSFKINHDTSHYGRYLNAGTFRQIKSSKTMTFSRLRQSLSKPEILLADYGKEPLTTEIFLLHRALSEFRRSHGREPRADTWQDADTLLALTRQFKNGPLSDDGAIRRLARPASHCLAPIAAAIGGIAAQEVLKSCTGKFTPLFQFLYLDCIEILPNDDIDLNEFIPDMDQSRYSSQIAVVGRSVHDKLTQVNAFLVGAGAIGCEILKNWAMMGVGTGQQSMITVTDMDTIERSNLSRQFLFRDNEVGQLKSSVAAKAVCQMNPHINIVAHSNRVGSETETIYDDKFWESLTIVCTALDNIDARLYVDQRCLYYSKPMMESGTMGTKGNTQIIVPHVTQSYGATRDPPEKAIPLCTLKNFPNQIEHTIQWSRDIFEGWFKVSADVANEYLSDPNFLDSLRNENPNALLGTLKNLEDSLCLYRPLCFADCVKWARLQFEKEFNHNIQQLLVTFPVDSVTSSGAPFWSGPKRAPSPLSFNIEDSTHMMFSIAASNLRAVNFGLNGYIDCQLVKEVLSSFKVPGFVAQDNVKIAASDEELKESKNDVDMDAISKEVSNIASRLPSPSKLAGFQLIPVEFEKDNDENFHVAFITACSNLRARNYRIPEASSHEIKRIAGKIIPAIATTTALVAGLICIEMYKILQNWDIGSYRNCFANLAIPLFSFAEPLAPVVNEAAVGVNAERIFKWTQWDHIDISTGDCTLEQLLEYMKAEFDVNVEMISFGASLLFAFFSPPATRASRMKLRITDLIATVSKEKIPPHQKYLVLEACVTNANDEDVDFPSLRLSLSR